MKIFFDTSTHNLHLWEKEFNWEFGQFRTPLTQYKSGTFEWVLDNGCYTNWQPEKFHRMMIAAVNDPDCLWIVVPDIVANSEETLERFHAYTTHTPDILKKAAFVAQDGCGLDDVPWNQIKCLFIGGSDSFKDGVTAYRLALEAKRRNKWVHIGRVNGTARLVKWFRIADSIDGSGISKYRHMREKIVNDLKSLHQYHQSTIDDWSC